MKKIATIASAAALAAASVSASAWWGAPYGPYAMTGDQQKAMQDQQAKAMEQMMTVHRQMAEQMAAQQAQMAKRMQEQGVDPMHMGFPGNMDPWGDMGPWGTTDPWGDMSMPEFPTMPEMPAFGQLPEPPAMPEMPEPFAMDWARPPVPAFMQGRHAASEAYRAKIIEESKTRREEMTKEIAERRKKIEANRFARPHRYGRPFVHPYTRMAKAPGMSAPAPLAAPTAEKTPAPVVEAAPALAPETAPTPAVPTPAADAAPAPAAPAAPGQNAVTPQG